MRIEPIIIKYEDGIEYTLEFDRDTVAYAEKHGFKIDEVGDKPMTTVSDLFFYAFRKNHPTVKREKTDHILFEELGGVTERILTRLIELYNVPYAALMRDEGGEQKNAGVEVIL